MKKHYQLLVALLFAITGYCYPQCLAPYTEANNSVHIFDGGKSTTIEQLPVQGMQVGRNNIAAYVTQAGIFKVYYNGETHEMHDIPSSWHMTDNWLLYQRYNEIKVLCDTGFQTIETQYRQGDRYVGIWR